MFWIDSPLMGESLRIHRDESQEDDEGTSIINSPRRSQIQRRRVMKIYPGGKGAAVAILDLRGALSRNDGSDNLVEMLSTLLDLKITRIVMNMNEILEVDSSGVESLLECASQVEASGSELAMSGVSRELLKRLCEFGLGRRLAIYESERDAVASFFEAGLSVAPKARTRYRAIGEVSDMCEPRTSVSAGR